MAVVLVNINGWSRRVGHTATIVCHILLVVVLVINIHGRSWRVGHMGMTVCPNLLVVVLVVNIQGRRWRVGCTTTLASDIFFFIQINLHEKKNDLHIMIIFFFNLPILEKRLKSVGEGTCYLAAQDEVW